MPKITDQKETELVTDDGEKVKLSSELELIKHIHGFVPKVVKNADIPKEELDIRWVARHKNTKNQAR